MTLRRFYCESLPAIGSLTLDRRQTEHARKSLRLAVGDPLELFDGIGHVAQAVIHELSHHQLLVTIQSLRLIPPPPSRLTLAVAIPKGTRADTLIDQATQLSVTHLIPLLTERTIVEPRDKKIDRFRRIVIEACKQSGRSHLMTIAPPTPLPAVLAAAAVHDVKLIADLPDMQNLHAPVSPHAIISHSRSFLVLVGPEGGWTEDERLAARAADFKPLALSPHTLRVETAALAAAAVLRLPA